MENSYEGMIFLMRCVHVCCRIVNVHDDVEEKGLEDGRQQHMNSKQVKCGADEIGLKQPTDDDDEKQKKCFINIFPKMAKYCHGRFDHGIAQGFQSIIVCVTTITTPYLIIVIWVENIYPAEAASRRTTSHTKLVVVFLRTHLQTFRASSSSDDTSNGTSITNNATTIHFVDETINSIHTT